MIGSDVRVLFFVMTHSAQCASSVTVILRSRSVYKTVLLLQLSLIPLRTLPSSFLLHSFSPPLLPPSFLSSYLPACLPALLSSFLPSSLTLILHSILPSFLPLILNIMQSIVQQLRISVQYNLHTCVSSMRRTLRTAPLVPIMIIVLVALSTRATIASEVALISAVMI